MRRMLVAAILAALAASLVAPPARAQSSDIYRDGWSSKSWYHLGNSLKGEVSAESWVELDWPCGTPRDIGMNCDIQRLRGHGLVKKESRVTRVEVGLVRLGRYPAGTLVQNERNENSGGLSQVEQTTAWYPVDSETCVIAFRAWTRTSFAVRWTDGRLSKLSLLSDPTTTEACRQGDLTTPERQQLRARLNADNLGWFG